MRRCASRALAGALLVIVAGCGPRAADPTGDPGVGLEIREPRASLQQDAGAVYLTVVNPGPEGDRLLRVETAAARLAETHESVVDGGGVVRMVARPEGFEVPAGGSLALEPGGKHVMLIEPRAAAPDAAGIALTLHFERAGAIEVQAALDSPTGPTTPAMDHSGHDMDHSGHAMDHGEHAPAATETAPPPSPTPSPTPSPEPR